MRLLTNLAAYRRLSGHILLYCCIFMFVNCLNQDIISYYSPCVTVRKDCIEKGTGVYPVCSDCTQFALCDPYSRLGIIKINCPSYLFYDVRTGTCVLKFLAICGSNDQKGSKIPDSSIAPSVSAARLVAPPVSSMKLSNPANLDLDRQTTPASTSKMTSSEKPRDLKSTRSPTRPTDQEYLGYPTTKESISREAYSKTPKSMTSAASPTTNPDTSAAYNPAGPEHLTSSSYVVYPTNPTSPGLSDKTLHPPGQVNINKKTNASVSDPTIPPFSGSDRTAETGSTHVYDNINSVDTYGGSYTGPVWTNDPSKVNLRDYSPQDFDGDAAKDGETKLYGGRGTTVTTAPLHPAANVTVFPQPATNSPAARTTTAGVVNTPILTTAATPVATTSTTTATPTVTKHPAQLGKCLTSCTEVPDGDYQSCVSCHVYVTCSNGLLWDNRPCPSDLVWDDLQQKCAFVSSTCHVPLMEQ